MISFDIKVALEKMRRRSKVRGKKTDDGQACYGEANKKGKYDFVSIYDFHAYSLSGLKR